MSIGQGDYIPGEEKNAEADGVGVLSFEEVMLARVKRDYELARRFREVRQGQVFEHIRQYYNARYYNEFREVKELPLPIGQQIIDQACAQMTDKLFFTGRPARAVGVEDGDKAAAEAKQSMMDWQDYVDHVRDKIGDAAFSCALRGMAVAKVDFTEKYKYIWQEVVADVPDTEAVSEQDTAMGYAPPTKQVSTWVKQQIPAYLGATVTLFDPQDLYFGPDKREVDDPFPLMIRSAQAKEYFKPTKEEPYWINYDQIGETSGPPTDTQEDQFKEEYLNNAASRTTSQEDHKYVEWHGLVKRRELWEWIASNLGKVYQWEDQDGLHYGFGELIDPTDINEDELCWVICGVVDQRLVVRLQEQQHGLDGPNVIVGCIEKDGSVFRGVSLMDKMYALCREGDRAAGQLIENILQNIDRIWYLNESAFTNSAPVMNKRGVTLTGTLPPDQAIKVFDQLPLTEPLQSLIAFYSQMAKDATQLQAITMGQGDPNAETLGESNAVEAHAVLGLNRYIERFEQTFIQPLYEMRNQINSNLIDVKFAFRVIGSKAEEWMDISPGEVKANVDFICESASRETHRAVLTQQLMTYAKEVAPLQIANGYPVRMDKLGKLILETGYTIPQDTIDELNPLLKLERDQGIDLGQLLAQSALMQFGVQAAMMQGVAGGGPPPNQNGKPQVGSGEGPMAAPLTETDAIQSANAENQTDVGRGI